MRSRTPCHPAPPANDATTPAVQPLPQASARVPCLAEGTAEMMEDDPLPVSQLPLGARLKVAAGRGSLPGHNAEQPLAQGCGTPRHRLEASPEPPCITCSQLPLSHLRAALPSVHKPSGGRPAEEVGELEGLTYSQMPLSRVSAGHYIGRRLEGKRPAAAAEVAEPERLTCSQVPLSSMHTALHRGMEPPAREQQIPPVVSQAVPVECLAEAQQPSPELGVWQLTPVGLPEDTQRCTLAEAPAEPATVRRPPESPPVPIAGGQAQDADAETEKSASWPGEEVCAGLQDWDDGWEDEVASSGQQSRPLAEPMPAGETPAPGDQTRRPGWQFGSPKAPGFLQPNAINAGPFEPPLSRVQQGRDGGPPQSALRPLRPLPARTAALPGAVLNLETHAVEAMPAPTALRQPPEEEVDMKTPAIGRGHATKRQRVLLSTEQNRQPSAAAGTPDESAGVLLHSPGSHDRCGGEPVPCRRARVAQSGRHAAQRPGQRDPRGQDGRPMPVRHIPTIPGNPGP